MNRGKQLASLMKHHFKVHWSLRLVICCSVIVNFVDLEQLDADVIGGMEAGARRYEETFGDTWISTWGDDDEIYVVSDDSRGFGRAQNTARNWMIHRLSGTNPLELAGTTINTMDEYGFRNQPNSELGYGASAAQDGRAWKANGITCIDGVIYVAVSKHDYPWRNKQLIDMKQTAADASIVKSVDHGLHWTRSAAENYARPMFRAAGSAHHSLSRTARMVPRRWTVQMHTLMLCPTTAFGTTAMILFLVGLVAHQ